MYSNCKTNWRSFKSKWHTYTNPLPDQYLTHGHSHITPAVVAMDSSASTFPLAWVQMSALPFLRRGDVCTQATFPCHFYVTILPTSPTFLFPEARSYWSVPLIWSILGASRKDHNSCHKIAFSFLLLWDRKPTAAYFLFLVQPILYWSPRSTRDSALVKGLNGVVAFTVIG